MSFLNLATSFFSSISLIIAVAVLLSPSTIARILQPLVEEGILNYEQIGGQMKIIALNDENEKTKTLIDFYEKLKSL